MESLDVATARWLVAPEGLERITETASALDDGGDALHLGARLRRDGLSAPRAAAILGAASARVRARAAGRIDGGLVLTRAALEQASHPEVSRWRAQRFDGQAVWDLCAGIGGDSLELARTASRLTAVEHDPGLAVLLAHNLEVHGYEATVLTADALSVSVPAGASVHADPGRREGQRRLTALRDHRPPVGALLRQHPKAAGWGLVLSPGVDLADPDLPDAELEFLQVGDRLVESVAWTGSQRRAAVAATATLLPSGETRHRAEGPRHRLPTAPPGEHLIEVAPAAVRARLHDEIGRELGAWRVDDGRALLSAADEPTPSPWYRARPVVTVLRGRAKAIRRWLRAADPAAVEFVFHGVSGPVDEWWRSCGRPPRGPRGYRIELVRSRDGVVAIVTDAREG